MSRTGRIPVPLPDGVTAACKGRKFTVEGPRGSAELAIDRSLAIEVDDEARQVVVRPKKLRGAGAKGARHQRAMWGTTRRLIANAVEGVNQGYTRRLQVVGVGYSAVIEGQNLVLRCGFANSVTLPIPDDVTVQPPESSNISVSGVGQVPCTTVTLESVDKQAVGQFAAIIRRVRPPEPYKGKGIRYADEEVKRKAGKVLAAGPGAP
jgi:large subunit ribosomal protein L6